MNNIPYDVFGACNTILKNRDKFIHESKTKRAFTYIIFNEINKLSNPVKYFSDENTLNVKSEDKDFPFTLSIIGSIVSRENPDFNVYDFHLNIKYGNNDYGVYSIKIVSDGLLTYIDKERLYIDINSPSGSFLLNMFLKNYLEFREDVDVENLFSFYIVDNEDDINEEENDKEK